MFSVELIMMVVVGGTPLQGVVGAVLTVLPVPALKDYDVLVYGAIVIVVVMGAVRHLGARAPGPARWQPLRAVVSA
jgi:hypothetical protein